MKATIVLQKKIDYENCPIYVRRNGELWEYLTVINGEIYSAHIVAKKSFFQRVFWQDYNAKQMSDITQYVLAMAQSTIDTVKGVVHSDTADG